MSAEPQPLPLVDDCSLDAEGLRKQGERYVTLGSHLERIERSRGRLTATFSEDVDDALVRETIEVERECCPFFGIAYDESHHRLTITVREPGQDPALDALRHSLGAEAAGPA